MLNKNFEIIYSKIFIMIFGFMICIILSFIFKTEIKNVTNEIFNRIIVITSDSYNDVSRLQRLGTIKMICNYMTSNGLVNFLFGNGIGSANKFMLNNPVLISSFSTTDNQYLSFFYEFGFISIILYMLIIFLAVINFFRCSTMDINVIATLCFLLISISMFFFESFGWTDVFIFLTISMAFMSIKNDKYKIK